MVRLFLPPNYGPEYHDCPGAPNTPYLQNLEWHYRQAFASAAAEVVFWDKCDFEAIAKAWASRQALRAQSSLQIPTSILYGNPLAQPEQTVYRLGHEEEAAKRRARDDAFRMVGDVWVQLKRVNVSDAGVVAYTLAPWLDEVVRWAYSGIESNRIIPPPRPRDFLTVELRQKADAAAKLALMEAIAPVSPKTIEAITRNLNEVDRELLDWLWPGRVPLGKLTLLAGDPGLGKSFVTLDIAARVSSGEPWPDLPLLKQYPSGVVLFNAEDDLGDTIAPRLDKAGADSNNIIAVEGVMAMGQRRHFTLEQDLPRLAEVIDKHPATRLVVIDPISAYTGKIDSHNNSDVRGLLAPLAELAGRRQLAVIAVTHLSKSAGTKAVYRAMGSLAFAAAARAVWAIVKDQNDPQRRLFLPAKLNLAQDPDGLAYRIVEGRVAWETDPVRMHADDAFAAELQAAGAKPRGTERRDAIEWLRDELADGSKPSKEIIEYGKECGFSEKTLRRAYTEIGAKATKESFNGQWLWGLRNENGQDGH